MRERVTTVASMRKYLPTWADVREYAWVPPAVALLGAVTGLFLPSSKPLFTTVWTWALLNGLLALGGCFASIVHRKWREAHPRDRFRVIEGKDVFRS